MSSVCQFVRLRTLVSAALCFPAHLHVLCVCVCGSLTQCVAVFQLVFEALHSQEPRGYVVGWIIAISLLVGILIFLLLAVLLWKVNTGAPTAARHLPRAAKRVSEGSGNFSQRVSEASQSLRLPLQRSIQLQGGGSGTGLRSTYRNCQERDGTHAGHQFTPAPLA